MSGGPHSQPPSPHSQLSQGGPGVRGFGSTHRALRKRLVAGSCIGWPSQRPSRLPASISRHISLIPLASAWAVCAARSCLPVVALYAAPRPPGTFCTGDTPGQGNKEIPYHENQDSGLNLSDLLCCADGSAVAELQNGAEQMPLGNTPRLSLISQALENQGSGLPE